MNIIHSIIYMKNIHGCKKNIINIKLTDLIEYL